MDDTQKITRSILRSHRAIQIVDEAQRALKKEAERRLAFYNSQEIEEDKREFINGEIVVQSPAKRRHLSATKRIFRLIDSYVERHELGEVHVEKALIRLTRNDFEPDVCFFKSDKVTEFDDDISLFPPPDLAVEILSRKTAHRDRGIKYQDYALHGVQEYWIIDPKAETIEQYLLKGEQYDLHFKSSKGEVECQVIEGLTFPVAAIFDDAANREAVRQLRQA